MGATDNQQRILLFLRRHGEASVAELSGGLSLTQVTVRHHLQDLMRAGMVSPPEKRRHRGPGRPEQCYSLTERAELMLPGNLPEFAQALLGTLEARHGPEWLRKALVAAGTRMAPGLGVQGSPDAEAHLAGVLKALDRRGYLAAASTWSGRRAITFAHCPYLAAARASPVMCAFDQALMEALLQEPAVLFRRIAERDDQCMFLFGA